MTRTILRHLAAIAIYAPIGILIGLLIGAGYN